jgi:hypothetical protein
MGEPKPLIQLRSPTNGSDYLDALSTFTTHQETHADGGAFHLRCSVAVVYDVSKVS